MRGESGRYGPLPPPRFPATRLPVGMDVARGGEGAGDHHAANAPGESSLGEILMRNSVGLI